MNHNPLASIGIPAYNEEKYLAQTLDSLRTQDYPNLEILISDNASTDGTREIGEAYARRDARIRYSRCAQNIGAIANFNRVFALSRGEYFMWAGGHDLWDVHFIRTCVNELLRHPKAVMCQGEAREINPAGEFVKIIPVDVSTEGLKPADRLRKVITHPGFWVGLYGLWRAEALRSIGPLPEIMGFDILAPARLSLLGEFLFTPSARLYFRAFPARTYRDDEAVLRVLPPERAKTPQGKRLRRFPSCKYTLAALRLIQNAPLSFAEKAGLFRHVLGGVKKDVAYELMVKPFPEELRGLLRAKREKTGTL